MISKSCKSSIHFFETVLLEADRKHGSYRKLVPSTFIFSRNSKSSAFYSILIEQKHLTVKIALEAGRR